MVAPGFPRPAAIGEDSGGVADRAGRLRQGLRTPARVGLSTKHPLALVNRGGATARDVLALAARIKRQVRGPLRHLARPEPVFVGFGATMTWYLTERRGG